MQLRSEECSRYMIIYSGIMPKQHTTAEGLRGLPLRRLSCHKLEEQKRQAEYRDDGCDGYDDRVEVQAAAHAA